MTERSLNFLVGRFLETPFVRRKKIVHLLLIGAHACVRGRFYFKGIATNTVGHHVDRDVSVESQQQLAMFCF